MNEEDYSKFVARLLKSPRDIWVYLTTADANLVHIALGISGEAGELTDAIKKHVIYRHPLDRANLLEELSDLEFFMEALRQHLGISRASVLKANVKKLRKRYAAGYSDKAAADRKDKQ